MSDDDFTKIDMGANVIDLAPYLVRKPVTLAETRVTVVERDTCGHWFVTVHDETTRRVTCRKCGVDVDPFIVLLRLAHRESSFVHSVEANREEAEKLAKDVERLRRERSSLRSQVKKKRAAAGMPQATCPTCGRAHDQDVGDAPCWRCQHAGKRGEG